MSKCDGHRHASIGLVLQDRWICCDVPQMRGHGSPGVSGRSIDFGLIAVVMFFPDWSLSTLAQLSVYGCSQVNRILFMLGPSMAFVGTPLRSLIAPKKGRTVLSSRCMCVVLAVNWLAFSLSL